MTVQLLGLVPPGAALTRSGAAPGDALFVSGTPGTRVVGLALEQGSLTAPGRGARRSCASASNAQRRRVALGERLRGFASACIDVSDGLLGDAGKLARASGLAAHMRSESLPLSEALLAVVGSRARASAGTHRR